VFSETSSILGPINSYVFETHVNKFTYFKQLFESPGDVAKQKADVQTLDGFPERLHLHKKTHASSSILLPSKGAKGKPCHNLQR
jgi:hypothetical protein